MTKPLASIIIPAYNMERYLKEAVDSALNQTYLNVEVVVVDDGSTDRTKMVLEPYIRQKKIVYLFQENKGLAGARNTGIKAAKGDYIALLDADDIFLPTKIERQVGFLESHPECDVCYCDLWHFFEENPHRMFKLQYQYYSGDEVFPRLLEKNFINPLTVVFRHSVFPRYGYFDEEIRQLVEDWEYWVRLSWKGARFCFLPEVLAKYRIRKASLSYNWASELKRKEKAFLVFTRLRNQLGPKERQHYHINRMLFQHWLKLWYAKNANFFPPLRVLHRYFQARRLRLAVGERGGAGKRFARRILGGARKRIIETPGLYSFFQRSKDVMSNFIPGGAFFIRLIKKLLIWGLANERYDAEDPFDEHHYFEAYASKIVSIAQGKVLDLGCGFGYLSKRIAEREEVEHVVAIDKIPESDFRFLGHSKISYLSADIETLTQMPGTFDTIVATEFIEHISEASLRQLLPKIAKALKKGGQFVGSTPDRHEFSGSPFHLREYHHQELQAILEKHFREVRIEEIPHLSLMLFWARDPRL